MSARVEVASSVLLWAVERARLDEATVTKRFPKFNEWIGGGTPPTLKQLEDFAQATHAPIGYLLLDEPPNEPLPIPDYRTIGDQGVERPSADLLDTIYQCEQRQEWYRSFARQTREGRVAFVGTASTATPVAAAAEIMRDTLSFSTANRGSTFTEAISRLAEAAEAQGVLVMVNGVVGSNTHRKLDPDEFRGFALADPLAPLVFVNGADTKAAQIFTLAHELAHLWLGESALSDADLQRLSTVSTERWCNSVAAEFLVPTAGFADDFALERPLTGELDRLAKKYKVSTLVVLRKARDVGLLTADAFRQAFSDERERVMSFLEAKGDSGGGSFYNTQPVRVSKRFARAIISSTREGNTLYSEAFEMLGFKKMATFNELAQRLGTA